MANELQPGGNDETGVFTSAVMNLISGATIPDPIKRNFLKAIGRLCTAAVEVPIAYLEGIAAERRVETQGRLRLIEKSADDIAEQMDFSPEYARAAVKKFGQRIVREQVNIDQIANKAAEALAKPSLQAQEQALDKPALSDDWLNVFEREAGQKSSEEMQIMFAKILAGEVANPNTYSIRSVRLLGSLDQAAAELFKRFCAMCTTLRFQNGVVDARVPSLGTNAAANGLRRFGLSFDSLNLLQECGLIISDYNSWMDYRPSVGSSTEPAALPFEFIGERWCLEKMDGFAGDVKVSGVALTRSGRELMGVVPMEVNSGFVVELAAWFETMKLRLIRAQNNN